MSIRILPTDLTAGEAVGRRYAVLYHRRRLTNAVALGLGDALTLSLALLLAGATRWWLMGGTMIPSWSPLLLLAWWLGAGAARLLPGWGLGPVEALRRTTLLLGMLFVVTAVGLFLSKQSETVSRLTVSLAFFYALPLLLYGRSLVKRVLIRARLWGLPTAIYGGGPVGRRVIETLRNELGIGYVPYAVFDDDPERWETTVAGTPVLGGTDRCAPEAPVAILAVSDVPRARVSELLEGSLAHYKQVLLIPDLFDIPTLWVRTRDVGGVLGLEITRTLLDPLPRLVKRTLDLVLVAVTLPLWLPLCALIALAIRLEGGGPVLYRQERVGKGNASFATLKFRTMVTDGDALLQDALARDPALRAEWETQYKLRRDPRVTRVGRFLRRTSLDELPQLLNVLRGEMALVGPRPLPDYHLELLSARTRHLRARLRPGLTGLWQVSGRSDAGNEGLERWDTYYVRNWSVWLDLVILARTFRAVLNRSGAY